MANQITLQIFSKSNSWKFTQNLKTTSIAKQKDVYKIWKGRLNILSTNIFTSKQWLLLEITVFLKAFFYDTYKLISIS